MGVESGPSGAIAVAGPSAGPAISAGVGVEGMAGAPVVAGIINEGPVRGSLEGFRLMNKTDITTINKGGTIQPLGEIVFNPNPLTAESAISEAEAIISEARIASPINKIDTVNSLVQPIAVPLGWESRFEPPLALQQPSFKPDLIGFPKIESKLLAGKAVESGISLQPSNENRTNSQAAQILVSPQIEEVEQIVEERVIERVEGKPETSEQIEELELGKRFVIDRVVLGRRIGGIREAVKKAGELAKQLGLLKISGRLINKFWNGENPDYLSQPVYPQGPDGSIPEIEEEIDGKEFNSEYEAEKATVSIVNAKEPIKEGKTDQEGYPAEQQTVNRVFKFQLIKPHAVYKEVIKRVTKKVHSPAGQAPFVSVIEPDSSPKSEPSLEELNPDLAEVFQKAA